MEPKIYLSSPVEVDVSTCGTDSVNCAAGQIPRTGATLTVPYPTFTTETDLAGDDATKRASTMWPAAGGLLQIA